MSWLAAALDETASYPCPERLDTFRASIDPEWIEEALSATGAATLRRRRLPVEQVIWLVLGMALLRDRPIADVVSKLDLALPKQNGEKRVAPNSIAQARLRVGESRRGAIAMAVRSLLAAMGVQERPRKCMARAVIVRSRRDEVAGRRLGPES